ncbi:hypothetical protein CHS0354_027421 [Potamilus streckersoni]|uniref:Methyltransferase HEMK2 n=1 Tax=Potamilus streckersoni TaxID=2493646 RepID=A0AAE0SYH3_9BIVA|nr:hypothetical protein CHS0354_027421 [Potamilus streckersoni]
MATIRTPNTSHLTSDDIEKIYEPAEDSFLLLDALEKERTFLKELNPVVCVEVGSGSGIVITYLAQLLGNCCLYLCTDINPRAAEVSRKTATINKVQVESAVSDLICAFQDWLKNKVDVLIFNPPYVITPPEEVGSYGIEASWAGGERGRQVMDRLFPLVPHILSPLGVFYLVIIKENDEADIERIMVSYGLRKISILSRRSGSEFLSVLRFNR